MPDCGATPGTYDDGTDPALLPCVEPCVNCLGPHRCLSCVAGTFLVGETCYVDPIDCDTLLAEHLAA
jgi:hypothetical protein